MQRGRKVAVIGKRVRDLDEETAKVDVEIIGLIRHGRRMPGQARIVEVEADDILILEASPDSLDEALGALQLEYVGKGEGRLGKEDLVLNEAVVQAEKLVKGQIAHQASRRYSSAFFVRT